jgi:hypothetical protein
VCCDYYPGIGTDGVSGDVWVAYWQLRSGANGAFAQRFNGSGARVGSPIKLPLSSTSGNTITPIQRVGTTGRGNGHPGVYVAYATGYPSARTFRLTRLGSGTSTVLATTGTSSSIRVSTVTADPAGGLWVLYAVTGSNPPALFARHSNAAVTRWSNPVRINLPAGTSDVYKVYGNAQANKLDVVARVDQNFQNHIAFWHTQVNNPPIP